MLQGKILHDVMEIPCSATKTRHGHIKQQINQDPGILFSSLLVTNAQSVRESLLG